MCGRELRPGRRAPSLRLRLRLRTLLFDRWRDKGLFVRNARVTLDAVVRE